MPLIGERVRALREQRGLTIKELSEKVGVKDNTIWRWTSKGVQPSGVHLGQLAEVLQTSIEYLMGSIDDPAPPQRVKVEMSDVERRILEAYRRGDPTLKRIMRRLADDVD